MGDLGRDQCQSMVCVETVNAKDCKMQLPGGGIHRMGADWRGSDVDMSERVAMVTGAGRASRAAAIELGRSGFQFVVLVSRTLGELEATAALCGGKAKIFICDVSDSDRVDKLIEDVLGTFGAWMCWFDRGEVRCHRSKRSHWRNGERLLIPIFHRSTSCADVFGRFGGDWAAGWW